MRPLLAAVLLVGCTPRATAPPGPAPESSQAAAAASPSSSAGVAAPAASGVANVTQAEEFRKRLRPLDCARQVRCGEIGASEQKACEQSTGQSRVADEILALAKQGRYTVDLSQTGACLALWTDFPCHVDRFAAPPGCVSGAVDATLRAAVPPGRACTRWDECAGGYCPSQTGCKATCVAYAPADAACDHNQLCASDAYCSEGTCRPRRKEGEPCPDRWRSCADGLWCEGFVAAITDPHYASPGRPGVCTGPKGEGFACATDENDEHCRADLFCDWGAADPTCRARLPKGADCGWIDACADGLTCAGLTLRGTHPRGRRFAAAVRGRCVPFADAGGPCDPTGYITGCPADMRCDEKARTCRSAGHLGEPCESSWVPPGTPQDRPFTRRACRNELYCNPASLTCARQPNVGEACTPTRSGVDDQPCWLSQCDAATRRCTPQCQ